MAKIVFKNFRALAMVVTLYIFIALTIAVPSWAQESSVAPDGIAPVPATDGNLILDSEGANNNTNDNALYEDGIYGDEELSSEKTQSQSYGNTFILVVVLILFCIYLYANQNTNNRLGRLESALKRGESRTRELDELVPFSWNAVLRSIEGGFTILPGLNLPRPCIFMLELSSEDGEQSSEGINEARKLLVSNIVRSILKDPELSVITTLKHMGSCDLGYMLLSHIAQKPWSSLEDEECKRVLRNNTSELETYEKSLYCLTDLVVSPSQLYDACQDVLHRCDIGVIVIDDLDTIVPDDIIVGSTDDQKDELSRICDIGEALRLLAVRCYVPVCVISEENSKYSQILRKCNFIGAVAKFSFEGERVCATFETNGSDERKYWKIISATGIMTPEHTEG